MLLSYTFNIIYIFTNILFYFSVFIFVVINNVIFTDFFRDISTNLFTNICNFLLFVIDIINDIDVIFLTFFRIHLFDANNISIFTDIISDICTTIFYNLIINNFRINIKEVSCMGSLGLVLTFMILSIELSYDGSSQSLKVSIV